MKKIKNHIELVSLHIPKTAGTAFRLVLNENVADKHFAKVDIFNSGRIKLNDQYFEGSKLSRKVKVIHGHFSYLKLQDYFDLGPAVEFITWLRDPVKRVLSNYYFLKNIVEERLQEQPDENLFPRIGKSLEEFIALEENQNVMSKFLAGAPLENFKFIGIQDNYAEDLSHLKQLMDWSAAPTERHNETKGKMEQHDAALLDQIRELNAQDLALYQQVLELKGKERA